MLVGWGPMQRLSEKATVGQRGAVVSSSILSNIDSVVADRNVRTLAVFLPGAVDLLTASDAVGPPVGSASEALAAGRLASTRVKRLICAVAVVVFVDHIRRVKRFPSRRGRRRSTRTRTTRAGTCSRAAGVVLATH